MRWIIFFYAVFSLGAFSLDNETRLPLCRRTHSIHDLKPPQRFAQLKSEYLLLPFSKNVETIELNAIWNNISIRGKVTYRYEQETLIYSFTPYEGSTEFKLAFTFGYGTYFPEPLYALLNKPDLEVEAKNRLKFADIQPVDEVLRGQGMIHPEDFSGVMLQ